MPVPDGPPQQSRPPLLAELVTLAPLGTVMVIQPDEELGALAVKPKVAPLVLMPFAAKIPEQDGKLPGAGSHPFSSTSHLMT